MGENIKDFILPNGTAEKTSSEKRTVIYETVTVYGTDFIIRRKTPKTRKLLIIVMSEGQFYIKDELTRQTTPLTLPDYTAFVKDMERGTKIVDKNGNTPPWLTSLPVETDNRRFFINALYNERFREYASKDMASMPDNESSWHESCWFWRTDSTPKPYPVYEQTYEILTELFGHDTVKDAFKTITYGNRLYSKIYQILGAFFGLRTGDSYMGRAKNYYTPYECIYDKFGRDGLQMFLKGLIDMPGTSLPSSQSIERIFTRCYPQSAKEAASTSFNARIFVEYLCLSSIEQGFADEIETFLKNWAEYLDYAYALDKEIPEKYPEYLLSKVRMMAYKTAHSFE